MVIFWLKSELGEMVAARWNLAVHGKLAPKERENVPEMSDKSPTAPKNQKKSQKNQNYEKYTS